MLTALPVGAPIRHADHALAASKGGNTNLANGNGRCARCNLTKDLTGWATQVHDGAIVTTTPTGHHHTSHPPRPPQSAPWLPPHQPWLPPIDIDIQWPGPGRAG